MNSEILQMADRLSRRVQAEVATGPRAISPDALGPSSAMVLLALDDLVQAPLHQLVARVGRDKSQITRVVKALDRKGLINRQPCERDGRVLRLTLTKAGGEAVAHLRDVIDRVLDEVLVSLEPGEREQLRGLLQKVRL